MAGLLHRLFQRGARLIEQENVAVPHRMKIEEQRPLRAIDDVGDAGFLKIVAQERSLFFIGFRRERNARRRVP